MKKTLTIIVILLMAIAVVNFGISLAQGDLKLLDWVIDHRLLLAIIVTIFGYNFVYPKLMKK